MVLRGLKEEETLVFLRRWAILSVVPWIYRRKTLEIGSTRARLTLGSLLALWKASRLWDLLYPLFSKTSRR